MSCSDILEVRSSKEGKRMSLHAAVVQFSPTTDIQHNIAMIQRLVTEAAEVGANIVVLPEYSTFTNPKMDQSMVESAQPLDGPSVNTIRELSAETGVTIIAGVNEPAGHGHIYNTLVAVQQANIVATYRKLHLYDAFGMRESQWVTPGELAPPQLIEVQGFKVGMQTCYDLRFPEVSRMLVDAGADVFAIPAAWVPGPLKEFHWNTLLTARAIENTVYLLAADQAGPTGVGHSAILDPMGVAIARVAEEEGLAYGDVTRERIDSVRATNPALTLRRFTTSPKQS